MNGIQLLIVPDNLLCKLDQVSPVCLQQLGHLDVFDLHKEFILCIYEDRLEEKKNRDDFFYVFGAFLKRAEAELLWSVRHLSATQLFLSV